jgi:hypothetical protein
MGLPPTCFFETSSHGALFFGTGFTKASISINDISLSSKAVEVATRGLFGAIHPDVEIS